MKDDSLPIAPHLLYLDIPCDFATVDFPCENSFPDVSTSDHSQDTSDVSMSLNFGDDTSSFENLSKLSSIISENTEGEHPRFSSTHLHDSSNHKDADKHLEFSDLGCHYLSTSSSDHDVDSIVVNLSKTLVYDDLSVDEVETPHTVEALQPELMVMLGPRCLRLVSLPIKKFLKHIGLLITIYFTLEFNQTPKFFFLHSNYTISSLMHWRNLT